MGYATGPLCSDAVFRFRYTRDLRIPDHKLLLPYHTPQPVARPIKTTT